MAKRSKRSPAADAPPGLVVAVDIGSRKVACLIGRSDGEGKVVIAGMGTSQSDGVRSGTIVDASAASECIADAVEQAERMVDETIRRVHVSIADPRVGSISFDVETAVVLDSVGRRDLDRTLVLAREYLGRMAEMAIVHTVPVSYSLDGIHGIPNPGGLYGNVLGARFHAVAAHPSATNTITACLQACHLDIDRYVHAAYASGLCCLTTDELTLGSILIDIGASVTTIAVFAGDKLVHTGFVPLGGMHITNDIARVVGTPRFHAETIKIEHGQAMLADGVRDEMIDVLRLGDQLEERTAQISRRHLSDIIRARVEEILGRARDVLAENDLSDLSGRSIVMTGGTSQLGAITDLAKSVFGAPVRRGSPGARFLNASVVGDPALSVAAGTLLYALGRSSEDQCVAVANARGERDSKSFTRSIWRWLKENL